MNRSRIQTFPASFAFSGSKTDQEQMIGNAVPVNLARFVGAAIREYAEEHTAYRKRKDAVRPATATMWPRMTGAV